MSRTLQIRQSKTTLIGNGGVALVGLALEKIIDVKLWVDSAFPLPERAIPISALVKSYVALLCQGERDFDKIEKFREDEFFMNALGMDQVPADPTLRQNLAPYANRLRPIVVQMSVAFLKSIKPTFQRLRCGHVPIDIDVFTQDNSNSKKEGVSYTYAGFDGFAPIAAYLGGEGYCIGLDLREGKQHSAREADLFLAEVILRACELVSPDVPLLIREDSGFDSEKIYAVAIDQSQMRQANGGAAIDFLIKWNPRKTPVQDWYSQRCDEPALWKTLREGKRVCEWEDDIEFEHAGKRYRMRRYYRMIERTIDKDGIVLLIPDVELDGWNTTLKVAAPEVTALYQDHGTHEQFHSEFKTDLDLERLPSSSFSMNALVLCLAMLTFNILRAIGQSALLSHDAPIRQKRQKAKRRRVRTVIDTMIHIAAKFVRHARRLVLHFSAHSPSFIVFERLYRQWAGMSLQL